MPTKREEVKAWIQEREQIEVRIESITKSLVDSGFGLTGGLIDSEGFPIPEVEKIFEIRAARNQLASNLNPNFFSKLNNAYLQPT